MRNRALIFAAGGLIVLSLGIGIRNLTAEVSFVQDHLEDFCFEPICAEIVGLVTEVPGQGPGIWIERYRANYAPPTYKESTCRWWHVSAPVTFGDVRVGTAGTIYKDSLPNAEVNCNQQYANTLYDAYCFGDATPIKSVDRFYCEWEE